MASRTISFVEGEYYHIYNRGVDKRTIFESKNDLYRFFQSMIEFNVVEPIGSIYENSFAKDFDSLGHLVSKSERLVDFMAYCLNPNHYHFILTPLVDKGIESFMQRLGNGYTKYFNNKEGRSGSLFQGPFKAKHIDENEYLLHLSVYVSLNFKVHSIGEDDLYKASWWEYIKKDQDDAICNKDIILEQFKNVREYETFAIETLPDILAKKKEDKGLADSLLE